VFIAATNLVSPLGFAECGLMGAGLWFLWELLGNGLLDPSEVFLGW